jgi:hypothetical protein
MHTQCTRLRIVYAFCNDTAIKADWCATALLSLTQAFDCNNALLMRYRAAAMMTVRQLRVLLLSMMMMLLMMLLTGLMTMCMNRMM